jgi:hypothetical protein
LHALLSYLFELGFEDFGEQMFGDAVVGPAVDTARVLTREVPARVLRTLSGKIG